jgi:uncharacterized protein YcbK (DUF882 family)
MDRRNFLKIATAGTIAQMLPPSVFGQEPDFWSQPRSLWLYRPETKEQVKATYFADGKIVWSEYAKICSILRDVQAHQAVQMSPVLLDILAGMQGWLTAHGIQSPMYTNSGYRSPRTNAHTEGADRNSLHMLGKAWDGYVPQISNESLGKFAMYLHGGGVGFYQHKNIIHVDDGKVRSWRG